MQYNTQQKRMPLPEYGRSIQNMVDYALTIQDRAERQRCANTIINIMGNMFPHLRDVPDFKHKLWDHLAIMSGFELDIDYPYEIIREDNLVTKPEPIPYSTTRMRYRHYGHTLEVLIKKACELPEGNDKRNLTAMICNHMKKDYMASTRIPSTIYTPLLSVKNLPPYLRSTLMIAIKTSTISTEGDWRARYGC